MECTIENNKKNCPCTYNCPNRGHCCACIAHHRLNNQLPACYFSEKAERTYDRSIDAFIKDYKERQNG